MNKTYIATFFGGPKDGLQKTFKKGQIHQELYFVVPPDIRSNALAHENPLKKYLYQPKYRRDGSCDFYFKGIVNWNKGAARTTAKLF